MFQQSSSCDVRRPRLMAVQCLIVCVVVLHCSAGVYAAASGLSDLFACRRHAWTRVLLPAAAAGSRQELYMGFMPVSRQLFAQPGCGIHTSFQKVMWP